MIFWFGLFEVYIAVNVYPGKNGKLLYSSNIDREKSLGGYPSENSNSVSPAFETTSSIPIVRRKGKIVNSFISND